MDNGILINFGEDIRERPRFFDGTFDQAVHWIQENIELRSDRFGWDNRYFLVETSDPERKELRVVVNENVNVIVGALYRQNVLRPEKRTDTSTLETPPQDTNAENSNSPEL